MGCRGVHFAVDAGVVARLLVAETDDEVMAIVEEVEESWERPFLFETDKAWDAAHRCLSDGTLDLGGGSYPLSHAILGGRQLHDGDDYLVALVTAEQVPDVAAALAPVDEAWLRARYATLESSDYRPYFSAEDLAYTWENVRGLAEFFGIAAGAGRAVIFTVDQ